MLSREGQVALARRHVDKGRDIISRQHRLIERKRAKGFDTVISQELLLLFETTQAIFEGDLDRLLQRTRP